MGDYQTALEAAGAKVLAFESFGSYQGDWLALVEFRGKRGFVEGYYGSCSGCDAFESEFGYSSEKCETYYEHGESEICEDCKIAEAKYQKRLADFGKDYLDQIFCKTRMLEKVSRNLRWDMDAQEMVDWVKAH